MNEANSSYITRVSVICLAGLLTLGIGTCGYTKYQDYRAEQLALKQAQAHKQAQATIKEMLDLCDFNQINAEEQLALDKVGDDVSAARRAITNMVDSRVVFWGDACEDALTRASKVRGVKQSATYWSTSEEAVYRSVSASIIKDFAQAISQRDIWYATRERLRAFVPGMKQETPKSTSSKI